MKSSWKPLLDRDPRDGRHVRAAMRMIASLSDESYVTERTMTELRQAGVRKIPGMRVGTPKHADALIGGFFFLEAGKLFPDNVLVSCQRCRAALQIRPHANRKLRTLCCFCALDEMLADRPPKVNDSA